MLLFSLKSSAQSTGIMATLNASGHHVRSDSGSVTYSIGQVFYTYVGEPVFQVAQGILHSEGFQEPEENSSAPEDRDISEDTETPEMEVLIYPNPTTDFITIATKSVAFENQINSYQLFNYQGKLLMQQNLSSIDTKIHLNHLSASMYIMRIFVNETLYKTFKILKK
jgi:hypothetical protein